MSTMWDVREMLNRLYPEDSTYKRPQFRETAQVAKAITNGTEIFERVFLGSMYVLGTTAPDTLVKSRDAMIVADQTLYPSNPATQRARTAPRADRAGLRRARARHQRTRNSRQLRHHLDWRLRIHRQPTRACCTAERDDCSGFSKFFARHVAAGSGRCGLRGFEAPHRHGEQARI